MQADITCVFILAQNRPLRELLTRLLARKTDLKIVGAHHFSPQLVQAIATASPDVLLSMPAAFATPQMHIVKQVCAAVPGLRVVMIGLEADDDIFLRAMHDGNSGYVSKDAPAAEVASAVSGGRRGDAVCLPQPCSVRFRYVTEEVWPYRLPLKRNLGLTRCQQELRQRIDQGLANEEIATDLDLSEQTVMNHIHRKLAKVGASDRVAAIGLCPRPGAVS